MQGLSPNSHGEALRQPRAGASFSSRHGDVRSPSCSPHPVWGVGIWDTLAAGSPIYSHSSARAELSTGKSRAPISSMAGSDSRQKIPLPKVLGGAEKNQGSWKSWQRVPAGAGAPLPCGSWSESERPLCQLRVHFLSSTAPICRILAPRIKAGAGDKA